MNIRDINRTNHQKHWVRKHASAPSMTARDIDNIINAWSLGENVDLDLAKRDIADLIRTVWTLEILVKDVDAQLGKQSENVPDLERRVSELEDDLNECHTARRMLKANNDHLGKTLGNIKENLWDIVEKELEDF